MSHIRFLSTSRGGRALIYKGQLFRLCKKRNDLVDWVCQTKSCGARVTLQNDADYNSKLAVHQHAPDTAKIAKLEFTSKMKEKISEDPLKTQRKIYEDARHDYHADESTQATAAEKHAGVQPFISIQATMSREKKKHIPPTPNHRKDVIITGSWSRTISGHSFILSNEGEELRIIIFGTEDMFRKLCSAKTVFMDGTFKSAPKIFEQIYTIHAEVMDHMFPTIFALLPNKQEETYERFLSALQNIAKGMNINFAPDIVQTDYEMAMFNAIKACLPNSRLRGCLFHFSQCIWRKVQSAGLVHDFSADVNINKLVRRLCAFPLIKIEHIDDAWLRIHGDAPNTEAVTELLDYFVQYWVDDIRPRYDRSIWNHSDNDGARTNNHLEGWHNTLNKMAAKIHPSLFELIKVLQNQQQRTEFDIEQLRFGHEIRIDKRKYRQMKLRFSRLKERYEAGGDTLEYMDAVSFLLKLSS